LDRGKRRRCSTWPDAAAGRSEDLAAALFLVSDEGSFMNAHDLFVDGGRIAMYD
jgi:hypothetical protein